VSAVKKKLVFATILTVFTVVLIIGIAEITLRLTGFGYATTPLIRAEIGGTDYWVGNPNFTRIYFPETLKRLPPPNRVRVEKASSTRRYMIVGGSAAAGDPDPDFSIARILEWILSTTNPDTGYEVLNMAYTACNSHVAAEVVRQSEPYDLDGIIVLVGNNEVIGPFGPGTTQIESAPSPAWRDVLVAIRKTKLGQLGQVVSDKLTERRGERENWRGMEHFLEHRIAEDDPRLQQVYANFQANLEDMEKESGRQGIPILLANVPVNLLDQPPFNDGGETLPPTLQAAVTGSSRIGPTTLHEDDILALSESNHRSAWLAYLAGSILHASARQPEADQLLQRARDLDQLRFRADSRINGIIRDQWARTETGWIGVDAEAPLIADNPKQALGFPHFYEHVHFSFRANFLIAREMARAILGHDNLDTEALLSIEWTDAAAALAYTPYDAWLILEEMEGRFREPPFTGIPGYDELTSWMDILRQRLLEQVSKAEEKALINSTYLVAIRNAPKDDRIRLNYANFLRAFGKPHAAVPFVETAFRHNPTDSSAALAWFKICLETGRLDDAEQALDRMEWIFGSHQYLLIYREQLEAAGN
jgi:hypothetical protein